jgi:hypothetical protein
MPGITKCAIENFKAVRRADMQGFCFEKKSAQAKPRSRRPFQVISFMDMAGTRDQPPPPRKNLKPYHCQKPRAFTFRRLCAASLAGVI